MRDVKGSSERYDFAVVGGGLAGLCAAIAAARHGVKTVLVQDRPVLGGNASSEIRMHVCGASCEGKFKNVRETGIIEEILLENKARNPDFSYAEFDTLLWEKARYQENLTLYLSTAMTKVECDGEEIKSIIVRRLTEEREIKIEASIFADCTGDGTLAYLAGAEYLFGRESKEEFGKEGAREQRDDGTMGNTIMFKAVDKGHKVTFLKPFWAYDFRGSKLVNKVKFVEINSGYWWIEVGGKEFDALYDAEKTREECLKIVYGVWDYIKNELDDDRAENLTLDWVGSVPAKREGRRFIGDYVLTERDVVSHAVFPDAVGYGGWHIDDHPLERFKFFAEIKKYDDKDETLWHNGVYTVPYRALYSKNVKNLYLGGRIVSVTHRALASTRVMATCAVLGQAVGTAAAFAVKENVLPREVNVKKVQGALLKDDCYIPHIEAETGDKARNAVVSCSSQTDGCECENVVNGKKRPTADGENAWCAVNDGKQWIKLSFESTHVNEVRIVFDSDLNAEITQTLSDWIKNKQSYSLPKTLVKDCDVRFLLHGKVVKQAALRNIRARMNVVAADVECDEILLSNMTTYGADTIKIFEIETY